MQAIALAVLLAILPAIDGDGTRNHDKEAEEGLSSRHEMAPPAHVGSSYNLQYMPVQRGKIWANLGWGRVTQEFNDDGDLVDLGQPQGIPEGTDAEITALSLNLGGAYTFYRIGDMNLNGGINFGMSQQRQTVEEPFNIDQNSGLSPQNLTVFGEIERPMYSLRLGYLQDLGSSPEAADERANSDLQNAFQFGGSAQTWTGNARLFGGADYFLTLPYDEDGVDVSHGDVAHLHAGAGYNFGSAELGLALLYRVNREGTPEPATPNREFSSGHLLSAAPYFTYAPIGGNYQVSIKGAMQREYQDYGLSLMGRNEIAPRLGVTVGVVYGI